jgi:hypothetical protein
MTRFFAASYRALIISILLVVFATGASAQILPGDAVSSPAAGNQMTAQIAAGANGSLVAWADTRTVLIPTFLGTGGPYFGKALGTMTDIYAARLDAYGKLLDTTPIVISQAMYNQLDPVVGWNGQNWLVVWMSERADNRYYLDIMATRVAPDGTVLDDPPLLLKTADTSINSYVPWSVSSDGTNWSVAYRSLDAAAGIFTIDGLRVAPDGSILDPGGKRLRGDSWNSGATNADLAFAGDEYLLLWLEINAATGGWIVRGQRLTPALDRVGGVFNADLLSLTSPLAPRVTSDGSNFLAVWFENRYYGAAQVFGTRISHTGQVLDPNGIAITPAAAYSQFAPDVTWDGHNYFVAYNIEKIGFNEDIYVTRVSATGAVLDSTGILVKGGSANQNQPTIAAVALGGAQVVWTDLQAGGGNPQDISTAAISGSGVVSASTIASRGAPRQASPRLAAGSGEFLAVFTSEISGQSRILAQRTDSNGNALDLQPIQVGASAAAAHPAVAWNGSVFLVVWEDSGQIYGRRLSPTGTLLDASPVAIMRGSEPEVSALGSTFLVVGDDAPLDPHYRFIYAVAVSSLGAVLGPAVQVSGSFSVSAAVTSLGGRWLVLWEGHATHDDPYSAIFGAFVNPDGSALTPFGISDGGHDAAPAAASNGSEALVTWADADIFGRRVLSDGTLLDTAMGTVISNAPGSQFSPAAAWDGTQFVLTWLDERNDLYPNQERGDIYGARVGLNGTVLDAAGFAVANSPLPEETPTVVSGNGSTFFAYAAFKDAAPYAAFRIALRRFPFNLHYSLAATPSSATILPGGSANFTVTIAAATGFISPITLSTYGLPAGATAVFNPPSLPGSGTSLLTIAGNARMPVGTYGITILGTSGAEQNTAPINLTVGPGSGCTYLLSSSSILLTATGGAFSFLVSTNSSCSWNAVSNAAWITITGGSSGIGSGTVDYSVAANPLTTSRTGTIVAAGQTFTVDQQAATCAYSISPLSQTIPAAGGSGTISVSTTTGCAWPAVSNATWISIETGATGSGSGTVTYSVTANNSTTARSGTLTVAGQVFTVNQPALLFSGSGRVLTGSGVPLAKVTMTFTKTAGTGPVPLSVQTDTNGNWKQRGFNAGTTYVVTPSKLHYKFTPTSRSFVSVSTALNFTGSH